MTSQIKLMPIQSRRIQMARRGKKKLRRKDKQKTGARTGMAPRQTKLKARERSSL
jgi:hypothetical protein